MKRHVLMLAALPLVIVACSGDAGTNSADTNSANATANAAPDEAAVQAFRALLECAATTESAKSQIGGETMFLEGEARDAWLAREAALRTRSSALQARMNADGAALGRTPESITEDFNAHIGTFVHGPGMGTRQEYAATVADQSDACAANYPDAAQ